MFKINSYSDFITFRATPSPLSTMKKGKFWIKWVVNQRHLPPALGTGSGESQLVATIGPSGQSLWNHEDNSPYHIFQGWCLGIVTLALRYMNGLNDLLQGLLLSLQITRAGNTVIM